MKDIIVTFRKLIQPGVRGEIVTLFVWNLILLIS